MNKDILNNFIDKVAPSIGPERTAYVRLAVRASRRGEPKDMAEFVGRKAGSLTRIDNTIINYVLETNGDVAEALVAIDTQARSRGKAK